VAVERLGLESALGLRAEGAALAILGRETTVSETREEIGAP
jgi:hypothetical protein